MQINRLSLEQRLKFCAWIGQEIDALKGNGASEADLQEPGFANLVVVQTLTNHFDEIRDDPEFAKAVFIMVHDDASPEYLRKWASAERENGNLDMAYEIEVLADRRERAGISPFCGWQS